MIPTFWQTNIHLPYDPVILFLANQVGDKKQIGKWGSGDHKMNILVSGDFMGISISQNLSNCTLQHTQSTVYIKLYLNKQKDSKYK